MKILKLLFLIFLFVSFEVSSQWSNTGGPPSSRMNQSLTTNGLNIFSGTNGGMVRSTTGGGNWLNIDNGLTYINVNTVKYFINYPDQFGSLFVGSGRVFWSTNNGDNWSIFPNNSITVPENPTIYSILNYNNKIWIGTAKGVYYYEEPTGWISINYGFPFGNLIKVYSLIFNGNSIFAGSDRGIFKLVDTTWVEKNNGLPNTFSYTLSYSDGYLYTGGGLFTSNVYISSDNGDNWSLSLTEPAASSIMTIGSNIFVATYGDGVWHSTNYGNNWSQINDGLSVSAYKLFSIAKNDQDLFIGTESVGVWKRPLSQIVTDVKEVQSVPTEFALMQNYPNPFNPSTVVSYQLPVSGNVILNVYDVLGNKVATLVDEYNPAGMYNVHFSMDNFVSGVYFYQLKAGDYNETRKMILLK